MGEEQKNKTEEPKESPPVEAEEKNMKQKESPPEAKSHDSEEGNKKSEDSPPPPAPVPPPEIVLRVYMHCEGCARKVRRSLKGFPGVEEVKTDCKNSQVVVKGEKADPIKVLERVQKKIHGHRKVELISPIPPPPPPPEAKIDKPEEKETPKDEKKEELPKIIVVLGVHMHCEACAQEIKRRILRMRGVESVEPDLKNSKVTVKGVFTPESLVDCIYRRTLKHATIIAVEPEKKEEEKPKEVKEEEKKPEEPQKEEKAGDDAAGNPPEKDGGAEAEDPKIDLRKNEFHYLFPHNFQIYPQRFVQEEYIYGEVYPPPPEIFSDENPNACSVM